MHLTKTLAIALETVGCCVVLAGIIIEVITRAPLGYVIITCGALTVAAGGMIFAKIIRKS